MGCFLALSAPPPRAKGTIAGRKQLLEYVTVFVERCTKGMQLTLFELAPEEEEARRAARALLPN